jgi:hypothetical protein
MFGKLFSRKKSVSKSVETPRAKVVKKYVVLKTKAGQILHAYPVGVVDHFYDNLSVITLTLKDTLRLGELIFIKGKFSQKFQRVESMQYYHKDITQAKSGYEIGIKVRGEVSVGDVVYRCVAHS